MKKDTTKLPEGKCCGNCTYWDISTQIYGLCECSAEDQYPPMRVAWWRRHCWLMPSRFKQVSRKGANRGGARG